MKKIISLLSLVLITTVAASQNTFIRKLSIGDTVPDLELQDMVQYHKPTVRLSQFRGKFLVLDFWSTTCKTCIHAFPKLESIQARFSQKLTIMPVSFLKTKKEVSVFLEKRKKAGHAVSLPTAVYPDRDNILFRLFPSDGYPHVIWINPQGTVQAITGTADLNMQNIEKWISSTSINLPVRNSQLSFSHKKPLLVQGNGGPDSAFTYRSILTPYIDSIYSYMLEFDSTARYTRLFIANASITDMIKECTAWRFDVHNERVVWEVKDKLKFVNPSKTGSNHDWKKANLYCYDLVLPSSFTRQQAFSFMRSDLCRYFNLTVTIEKKPAKCWVLHRVGDDRIKTRGGTPQYRLAEDGSHVVIKNRPVAALVSFLASGTNPIVIDETGYTQNIDIELKKQAAFDPPSLNEGLAKYGLHLTEAVRDLDYLVIRSNL